MKPTKDRLLLKQWEWPEKTAGGIIMADTKSKDKPNIAKVVEVGPDVATIVPGMIVFLGTKWFTNLTVAKEDYLVVNEPDIAGIADRADLVKLSEFYSDPTLHPDNI